MLLRSYLPLLLYALPALLDVGADSAPCQPRRAASEQQRGICRQSGGRADNARQPENDRGECNQGDTATTRWEAESLRRSGRLGRFGMLPFFRAGPIRWMERLIS
jgi:hypothetical protein